MTQYHQNSRRPPRRNNNNRNHHSAPRVSNWLDEHQREDDRIAPSGVSASTHRLQQWALSTAGMIQQPTKRAKSRALEEEIRDRIQRRYEGPRNHRPAISESDDISMDQNAIIDLTGDDTSASVLTSTTTKKRPRSHLQEQPIHSTISIVRSHSSAVVQGRRLRSDLSILLFMRRRVKTTH